MSYTLFPLSSFKHGFTTNPSIKLPNVSYIAISDFQALGIHRVTKSTGYPAIVKPPQALAPTSTEVEGPELALEAFFPEGSINPGSEIPGGFGFYLSGPDSLQLAAATEVVWSYHVLFESGWQWAKGGKLPGIFGGIGDLAYRCTGGRKDDRCKCFDVRLMWRMEGAGEMYAYVPLIPTNTDRLLSVPGSRANSDYGVSVGRGLFQFSKGGNESNNRWVAVALRIRLNDDGKDNGVLELFIDGESMLKVDGLVLRTASNSGPSDSQLTTESENAHIKGMHFQTFFGGHTTDWASPRTQRAWFADISAAVIS